MSQVITINIPHQLPRDEVRKRIDEAVARAEPQIGPMGGTLQKTWAGDTLDFSLQAVGQAVTGKAFVEDRQVRVEVALPWMLASLGGVIRQAIEQHGRQALGHRAGTGKG
jgi:putative polyhydroxyalkanoate system protein